MTIFHFKIFLVILLLVSFSFLDSTPAFSQENFVAKRKLIGAAPNHQGHKFIKKIDTSGNIHKQSPEAEKLDAVRGPNIMAACSTNRVTLTGDDTFCNNMGNLP